MFPICYPTLKWTWRANVNNNSGPSPDLRQIREELDHVFNYHCFVDEIWHNNQENNSNNTITNAQSMMKYWNCTKMLTKNHNTTYIYACIQVNIYIYIYMFFCVFVLLGLHYTDSTRKDSLRDNLSQNANAYAYKGFGEPTVWGVDIYTYIYIYIYVYIYARVSIVLHCQRRLGCEEGRGRCPGGGTRKTKRSRQGGRQGETLAQWFPWNSTHCDF